jgi:hypothetical protein
MKLPRAVMFAGGAAAVVMIAAVAGALLLPWLIDTQLMKQRISSQLANDRGNRGSGENRRPLVS